MVTIVRNLHHMVEVLAMVRLEAVGGEDATIRTVGEIKKAMVSFVIPDADLVTTRLAAAFVRLRAQEDLVIWGLVATNHLTPREWARYHLFVHLVSMSGGVYVTRSADLVTMHLDAAYAGLEWTAML